MKMSNALLVEGRVHLQLFNEYGELIRDERCKNIVVNDGRKMIASRLRTTNINNTAYSMYMGVGTSNANNTSPNHITQTSLNAASGNRVAASTAASEDQYGVVYQTTFPAHGAGAGSWNTSTADILIVEAAIFNASSATTGDMLCRTTFGVITKRTVDTLQLTWTVSINAA